MASKRQMGYKCRIALVLLLLLASIAALVAIAVIQDAWASKEYSLEVNAHTCMCAHTQTYAQIMKTFFLANKQCYNNSTATS